MSSKNMMWLALLIGLLTSAVAVLGVVVWRQAAVERRRSEARIAVLARAIDGPLAALDAFAGEAADAVSTPGPGLLLTVPAGHAPSRLPAFGIAFVMILGVGALLAAALSGTNRENRAPAPGTQPSIELVSLRHAVDGDTLIVSGLVRNRSTVSLPPLAAEISVVGRDGQIVARSRSALEPAILGAGKETSFRVAMTAVRDPGRYRVAFSSGSQIMPHVDRRDVRRAARATDE